MAIYIPKPEPIEVYQWFKNGDMPGDGVINNINSGAIVGRHVSHGNFTGYQVCTKCDKPMGAHGVITKRMGELEFVVCPGDWVVVHRDPHKKVYGYSTIRDKILKAKFIDVATVLIPPPSKAIPQQVKRR